MGPQKSSIQPFQARRVIRHKESQLEFLVHEGQRGESERNMKKTSSHRKPRREVMRREYRFDYHKSRQNRFAPLLKGRTVVVVLDPDVASVFQSPESVNSLLRSVITALPRQAKVSKESARRLANLGGTEKQLRAVRKRRSDKTA